MIKKLLSLMLVLSIFTVNASAASHSGLKQAFDELTYTLTVETNGKDDAASKTAMKNFSTKVRELRAQGLTNAEMIAFVKSEVKDAKVAAEIEAAFNMINLTKMDSKEAAETISSIMKKSEVSGASWSGGATVLVVAVIALVVVAVALRGSYVANGCYNDEFVACDTQCEWYGCYEECYCTGF
ncbi:MAG TPA: hypothetical protein VNJ01_12195 [Bacteriovoracaceae bacterium]|nr:hypothetical protein [Bacteriovoracaceae bacterium]